MSRVKYVNKVFRLKKPMEVNLKGVPQPLQFKLGESQEALKCWELAQTFGEGSLQLADKILKKSYVNPF